MATQTVQTLESGNVYFFFRPRVEEESPETLEDAQRMFVVLSPRESKDVRLLVIGRKQLPEPEPAGREKNWGFVDSVSNTPEQIENRLDPRIYKTKTCGTRRIPAVRPLGEGVYRISRHDDHTHFIYALELPKRAGEAQSAFHIEEQASYIINIKNPEKPSPPGTGLPGKQQASGLAVDALG